MRLNNFKIFRLIRTRDRLHRCSSVGYPIEASEQYVWGELNTTIVESSYAIWSIYPSIVVIWRIRLVARKKETRISFKSIFSSRTNGRQWLGILTFAIASSICRSWCILVISRSLVLSNRFKSFKCKPAEIMSSALPNLRSLCSCLSLKQSIDDRLTRDDRETRACFYLRDTSFVLSIEFYPMVLYVMGDDFPWERQYDDRRRESRRREDVIVHWHRMKNVYFIPFDMNIRTNQSENFIEWSSD